VPIYYGDVFFEKDAKSIKLTNGEEYSGADITIQLSKLHTVSGSLVNNSGQPVNSGNVGLYSTTGNSEVGSVSVSEDDATFYIDLVPDGTYTLRVTNAQIVNTQMVRDPHDPNTIVEAKQTTLATYADYQAPLQVNGDIKDLTIAVPDKRAEAAQPAKPSH
jgi:FtsP/CotA-like multicopper oxidase with cupredoxin domain